MSFRKELLELLVVLSPLLIVTLTARSHPKTIPQWVGTVLMTSVLAVLATGFSMMRFVARCTDTKPPCASDQVWTLWRTGLVGPATSESCFRCTPLSPDTLTSITIAINSWMPFVSVGIAALCVLLSALMLVRFARWSRVHYRA